MRERVLGLLVEGFSAREVGRRVGLERRAVAGFARREGLSFGRGLPGGLDGESLARARSLLLPVAGMDDEQAWLTDRGQLSEAGRGAIQAWVGEGRSPAWMARRLGVHRCTVGRELGRFGSPGRYRAREAQAQVEQGRARPKPRKLDHLPLRAAVIERLNRRWSPEQVAADLQACFPGQDDMRVSHETIYEALYVQGKGSLRAELTYEKAVRTGRTSRQSRSGLAPRAGKSWVGDAPISARPAEAADRAVPGHWEGDLVIGAGGRSALITLAERSCRYTLIHRLPDRHDAATVTAALSVMMGDLPASLRRTLTWDQGSEMARHAQFTIATGCAVYFCDPHSPWQRGTNENTNGLVRDWYPKGTDFTLVTDERVREVQDLLNTRPRKTLKWATPAATLNTFLLDVAATA